MSERYNLMLGQGLVCQAPVRRKYYRWMLLYLLFAGALLIEGAYQVTLRMGEFRSASIAVAALKWDASLKYDGADSLTRVMTETMARGSSQNAKLAALGRMVSPSIPFLPVLFEIQTTLPAGVRFETLEMNAEELTLTVFFPVSEGATPEDYVAQWRDNEVLSRYLKPLQVVDDCNFRYHHHPNRFHKSL